MKKVVETSKVEENFLPKQDKKNIKLIPINPAVCFATTTSTSVRDNPDLAVTSNNSNGHVFVPVIDISGKKYLPVYLKQNNEIDDKIKEQKDNFSMRKTPTIVEENENETSPPPVPKRNVSVERLSMSQIDQMSNANHKNAIRVPSHIFMRRSPEVQKNLRAKTVRIGKIRWPPPLNPDEADNATQQRRMLVQRRIQEEIHGNKRPKSRQIEENPTINVESRSPIEERVASTNGTDESKRISTNSIDSIPPLLSDHDDEDEEMSTNEIVARNQSKLDFHQTMTPMLGKENFELRKKLFENGDDPSFNDVNDPVHNSKSSSRQSQQFLIYQQMPWKIRIRKEVFSPLENFDQPLIIDLLYLQILCDTFSPISIRINENERNQMKNFLASRGVLTFEDFGLIGQNSMKKNIIEQARQWPTYFSRFFPISMPKYLSNEVQMLAVSHSAIRLIKRKRTKTTNDSLEILETISFDQIQKISVVRAGSTLELRLKKKRLTIHSHRIDKIKEILEKFHKEFRRTPTEEKFKTSRENLSNTSDLLKSSSQASLISCSQTFSELIPSLSLEIQTPKPTRNEIPSTLPNGHSMMEFALQNFHVPNRKRSKKNWKNSEWTWQDYADLLKWSKTPISSPLLRHSSNDVNRLARQTFVAIMRFMGDHSMSRGQSDIDCVCFLLKNLHKHRSLIDEVFCQLIKQITENQSSKHESDQRGWKLLVIILNYFVPSEHLRPYFVKYLNDHDDHQERLVPLALKHYEQTLKYGGRKNTPSKAEVDLLTANGRNGGKRQTFLLPGGNPITLLTTPSMVMNDCWILLCDRANIPNGLEYDEYSIFIISASENSSRLLDPTEYLFDVLSECVRSHLPDYHLIVKRMLWYNLPIITTVQPSKSEIFIDFMFHQLVPEVLEGTMIIIKNNHLSDDLMQQISLLAALQYRAANKIGLPSMREVKHLLPTSVLKLKSVRPQVWTTTVHEKLYSNVESMTTFEAKLHFIDVLQDWPLFGMTFFVAQTVDDLSIRSPCLIGLNKNGIQFLDIDTRETLFTIIYNEVVSIRRHQHTIDIKHGSLTQPRIVQCQIDRAQDFVALAGRYLSLVGRSLTSAIDRKSVIQSTDRPLTSAYNDPISTIL